MVALRGKRIYHEYRAVERFFLVRPPSPGHLTPAPRTYVILASSVAGGRGLFLPLLISQYRNDADVLCRVYHRRIWTRVVQHSPATVSSGGRTGLHTGGMLYDIPGACRGRRDGMV